VEVACTDAMKRVDRQVTIGRRPNTLLFMTEGHKRGKGKGYTLSKNDSIYTCAGDNPDTLKVCWDQSGLLKGGRCSPIVFIPATCLRPESTPISKDDWAWLLRLA